MTQKQQKILSSLFVSLAVILGFQALIYVVNLNQILIFVKLALVLWVYICFKITLFYDLHFKHLETKPGNKGLIFWLKEDLKVLGRALWVRFIHARKWKYLRHWLNYLILPTFIFWATTGIFYLNLGNLKLQQIFALFSSVALILNFWYLKEAFSRQEQKVGHDIFSALSGVKIYALTLTFGIALALMRRFCESEVLFAVGVFAFSFPFTYQSLFQSNLLKIKTLLGALGLALIQALIGYFVYMHWGLNYFTAAIFQIAIYNFLWSCYHHFLENTLTKKVLLENLFLTLIIVVLVFSNTNFKARILNAC
jgi:hypothetical protein